MTSRVSQRHCLCNGSAGLITLVTRLIALVQAYDEVTADEEALDLASKKFEDLLKVGLKGAWYIIWHHCELHFGLREVHSCSLVKRLPTHATSHCLVIACYLSEDTR